MDWMLPSIPGTAVLTNLEYIWNWFTLISWMEKIWAIIALTTFCVYPFVCKRKTNGIIKTEKEKKEEIKHLKIYREELKQWHALDATQTDNKWKNLDNKWEEIIKNFPQYESILMHIRASVYGAYNDSHVNQYNRLCKLIEFLESGSKEKLVSIINEDN